MKTYEIIFFDLDGTIVDSSVGVTNSAMYALEKFGIEVKDRTKLYKFIGPPLFDAFTEYYGFSTEDATRAVEYYREYYRETGMLQNSVYDGIEDLFKFLKRKGKSICLATSKPEVFAKRILEHSNLIKYFDYIAGATLDGTRDAKADVINYALKLCGVDNCSKVLMIGDRKYDVIGAKEFGVDSVGVLFGFGNREELEMAGATYIAETAKDIEKIFI